MSIKIDEIENFFKHYVKISGRFFLQVRLEKKQKNQSIKVEWWIEPDTQVALSSEPNVTPFFFEKNK